MTAWYVLVAIALVSIVLTLLGAVGMLFYAQNVNATIVVEQREAREFSVRAAARNLSVEDAALTFESRLRGLGIHTFIGEPPPRPPGDHRLPANGAPPPDGGTMFIDGQRHDHMNFRVRFEGARLGFAVAALFGVHLPSTEPFYRDTRITFGPDTQAFQNVALAIIGGVLLASTAIGVLAWLVGRFITSQAIRPLVDVTHALQRFAARDFSPRPIDVARSGDFDTLAHAYNAAAAQVSTAFAEGEAAEAQMRQFVADAGHELRTPLTIMLGYIDLLRRRAETGDERSNKIFGTIGAEGQRMRTLIDNLVLLAKLEGDDVRPPEPFDLVTLLDELVSARRELARNVRFSLDATIDADVIGNRGEVHEAIANVVDNAIKYAPGSAIAIRVAQRTAGTVDIDVSDNGPGIAEEDRAGIFERFYRGANRGDVDGSGLGLAIAKRVIDRAGGVLSLASSGTTGTTFRFRLRADAIRPRVVAKSVAAGE